MSKKSKKIAQAKRLSMKRARRETMQRQYQQFAAEGKNNLSKRNKLNRKRQSTFKTTRHAQSYCGNVGCLRCHVEMNHSSYAVPGSWNYRKRFMKRAKS